MESNQWQRWKGIMKCYPFEEKRLAKWKPPYIVQPKYDGIRCKVITLETSIVPYDCMLLSSEENIIYSVPHINKAISGLKITAKLDGELYCHGMSFEQILSITKRTVNIHPEHQQIQFHIFDVQNDQMQMKRSLIIENLRGLHPALIVSPFWICSNLDEVKRAYDSVIKMGYEGIIIRHSQAPYLEKRSIYVMKFKPKKKDTYEIIGWNEEISKDGVPKDRIGSIICSSQEGDEFAVSAGLDSDAKARLWLERDKLAGKRIVVHYQHLTNKQIPKGTFKVEVIEDGRHG